MRQMRSLLLLAISAIALNLFVFILSVPVRAQEGQLDLDAESVVLVEMDTGKIVYEKDASVRLYPASVTKIMTVLLTMQALEEGKVSLQDRVYVSQRASGMGGSQIFLSEGDEVSLEDLLIGILVGSGNDAAMAVAEHVAGSVEGFVELMNEKARELNMQNTSFTNPHGLHDDGHFSSAYDISIMSRELLSYPKIYEWTTIWMDEHFLEGQIKAGKVYLSNSNRLVRFYQGCDGLKTGYTSEAQHNISATALRGDTRFIAVVLKSPTRDRLFADARTLLDFGFSHFQTVPVARANDLMGTLPVDKGKYMWTDIVAGASLSLLVPRGEKVEYEKEIVMPYRLSSPLKKGEKVGELIARWQGEEARVDLVAAEEVPRASYFTLVGRLYARWVQFGR